MKMIKLTASYGKKVPAESDYSSKSYHAQIEVEIPDGLNSQQLHDKVHGVFAFVRDSVEAELQCVAPPMQPQQQIPPMPNQAAQPQPQAMPANGACAVQPVPQTAYNPQQGSRSAQGNGDSPATRKQLNYLLSLVKRAGWTVQQLLQHCNVATVEQITSRTCSQLIQQFSGQAA